MGHHWSDVRYIFLELRYKQNAFWTPRDSEDVPAIAKPTNIVKKAI